MLSFDEASHLYYWNGQPVPNVTKIIGPLVDFGMVAPEVLERARQEGVAIHKMVELEVKGDLDVDTLPDWMRGRYAAWCRFREDSGFELIASETRMYHSTLGYAGTPDLFCLLPRLKHFNKGIANIDLKRSLFGGPSIGLQTAAYSELKNREKGDRVRYRAALVLNDNKTYRLTPFEDPDDWTAFLACLQQLRWKEKHYGRR